VVGGKGEFQKNLSKGKGGVSRSVVRISPQEEGGKGFVNSGAQFVQGLGGSGRNKVRPRNEHQCESPEEELKKRKENKTTARPTVVESKGQGGKEIRLLTGC